MDSKSEEDLKTLTNAEFNNIYSFVFGKMPSKGTAKNIAKIDQAPSRLKSKSPEMLVSPSYPKFSDGFGEISKKPDEIKSFSEKTPFIVTQPVIPDVKMPISAKDPIPDPQEKLIRAYLRTYIAVANSLSKKHNIGISNTDKDPIVFIIRKIFAEADKADDFIDHMGSNLSKYGAFFSSFLFLPHSQYKQIVTELSAIKSALQRTEKTELRKAIYLYLLTVSSVFDNILFDILEPAGKN